MKVVARPKSGVARRFPPQSKPRPAWQWRYARAKSLSENSAVGVRPSRAQRHTLSERVEKTPAGLVCHVAVPGTGTLRASDAPIIKASFQTSAQASLCLSCIS